MGHTVHNHVHCLQSVGGVIHALVNSDGQNDDDVENKVGVKRVAVGAHAFNPVALAHHHARVDRALCRAVAISEHRMWRRTNGE